MLSEMTIHEFQDWQRFIAIEPFEEQRADWRNAMLVSTIRNIFRGKGRPLVQIKDFLLQFLPAGKKKQQTPEEQEQIGFQWYLMSIAQERQRQKQLEQRRKLDEKTQGPRAA